MSQHERTGTRDLVYSSWHRAGSTRRYLGAVRAAKLSMIDIDGVEYCRECNQPLALIETKHFKATVRVMTVTQALADRAGLPAYLVRYWPSADGEDIERFEIVGSGLPPTILSPQGYADWLWDFRVEHRQWCKTPQALAS